MRKLAPLAAAVLALATLSGCAATSPAWDSGFGSAVRTGVAAQVIDPAAVANPNPVTGIDARAAQGAQTQYERSFSHPTGHLPAMISGSGK